MLSGGSGLDLCRDVRAQGIQTPILFLTARAELADKVVGLKLGGDDYLTKALRDDGASRAGGSLGASRLNRGALAVSTDSYKFGDVAVDLRRAEVTKNGVPVELSALEYKLLRYFVAHPGAVLSREELLSEVWGYQQMPHSRTVDVHVSGLRQKIEKVPSHPDFIVTVHGLGYKFVG